MASIEICAGAGGQALGLERAGFHHLALVENDHACCETLRSRRIWAPHVRETDLQDFRVSRYRGRVDLLAGGVPCPPFSRAGKRLGHQDERDLFPEALRLVEEALPRAVMLENVRNLLSRDFDEYRAKLKRRLAEIGYVGDWRILNASEFGLPQNRSRAILVAFRNDQGVGMAGDDCDVAFSWPEGGDGSSTIGQLLRREMASNGWPGAKAWSERAAGIAPALVGGSKKHGGPDLGPTQAKKRWAELSVDGHQLANEAPPPDFPADGLPRLTVRMAALVQGFPPNWRFSGAKTAAYRQVGNAFPPPVAEAVGASIRDALLAAGVGLGSGNGTQEVSARPAA